MTSTFKGFGAEPEPTKVTTRSGLTKHLVQNHVCKVDDLSKWPDSKLRGMPVWWMPNEEELQVWWWSIGNPQKVGDQIEAVSIRMGFAVHFDPNGVIDGFLGINEAEEFLPAGKWPGDWHSARTAVSEAHPLEAWEVES